MVRIKLLRTVIDSRLGHLDSGRIVSVSRQQADQLVSVGAALEVLTTKMLLPPDVEQSAPVPLASTATTQAQSSSSHPARAPSAPISRESSPDAASSSTMRGDSEQTPQSSTRATPSGGTSITAKSPRGSRARGGRSRSQPPSDTDST